MGLFFRNMLLFALYKKEFGMHAPFLASYFWKPLYLLSNFHFSFLELNDWWCLSIPSFSISYWAFQINWSVAEMRRKYFWTKEVSRLTSKEMILNTKRPPIFQPYLNSSSTGCHVSFDGHCVVTTRKLFSFSLFPRYHRHCQQILIDFPKSNFQSKLFKLVYLESQYLYSSAICITSSCASFWLA